MFELANRLVGIYKTFNCTKSVALSLENVDEAAAASEAAQEAGDHNKSITTNNNHVGSPNGVCKTPSQSQIPSQAQSAPDNDAIRDEDF